MTKSASGLTLQWTEGDSGEKPTTGYIIEARPSGKPWETREVDIMSSLPSVHAEKQIISHPTVERSFVIPVRYGDFVREHCCQAVLNHCWFIMWFSRFSPV